MRIVIDWDLCQGHGVCMGEAPTVFHVGDDGKLSVLIPRPPASLAKEVAAAAKYCPTGAITVEDQD